MRRSSALLRCLFVTASLVAGGGQAATFGELAGSALQHAARPWQGGYAPAQQRPSPWGNPQASHQQGDYAQRGGQGQGYYASDSLAPGARTSWQSGYPAKSAYGQGYGQGYGNNLERSTVQVITRRGDSQMRAGTAELASYAPNPRRPYERENTPSDNAQELTEPDTRLRPYDYRQPGGNQGYAAPNGGAWEQNPYDSSAPVNLEAPRYPYTANQPQQRQPEYYVVRAPLNGPGSYPPPAHIYGSYGQASQSNPYNYYGLQRGARVVVPWSTPMSSWVNQQKWEWWRQRAGDQRGYGMYSY